MKREIKLKMSIEKEPIDKKKELALYLKGQKLLAEERKKDREKLEAFRKKQKEAKEREEAIFERLRSLGEKK